MPPLARPIDSICIPEAPNTTIARVELGLTLYLADTMTWARTGIAKALEAFLRVAPRDWLTFYMTSVQGRWRNISEASHPELVVSMGLPASVGKPRHLLRFELTDDVYAHCAGFMYREIDTKRNARAGILEVTLPQETDPAVLLGLANELAALGPFHSGIGGYVARWNAEEPELAFQHIHHWTRRYWGIDVQDAERFSWFAAEALPGSNWLNLVGHGLADHLKLDMKSLVEGKGAHGVQATALQHGTLVRAGEASVGDLNTLVVPAAYAEAVRWLGPGFVEEPLPFEGPFKDPEVVAQWQNRFLEPKHWSGRE